MYVCTYAEWLSLGWKVLFCYNKYKSRSEMFIIHFNGPAYYTYTLAVEIVKFLYIDFITVQ